MVGLRVWALLALLFAAAIPAIAVKDLWTPDEPRYAEVAREMRVSGDFLTTRWNGQHYKEKPPLLFWAMNGFGAVVGSLDPWVVRLPSLFAAAGTTCLVFLFAEEAFVPAVPSWSVLILLTTFRFWLQATTGQIDMLLTLCTTLSWWALWKWDRAPSGKWLALVYGGMALGALAKGPVAILVPLLAILAFYWRDKRQWLRMYLPLGAALSLAPVGAWLWFARTAAGGDAVSGMGSNLFFQTIGRVFLGQSHAHGPLYYLYNLPVDLLPWSVVLLFALPLAWRERKRSRAVRYLLCSTLPAFVFFSLITGKRALYLLPLYPALAILLALGLNRIVSTQRKAWLRVLQGSWFLVLLAAVAAPVILAFGRHSAVWSPMALGLSAVAMGVIAWTVIRHWISVDTLPRTIALGTVALYIAAALFVFPTVNRMKAPKAFCEPLLELTRSGVDYDIVSLQFSKPVWIYYTEHFHRAARIGLPSETCSTALSEDERLVVHDALPDALAEEARILSRSPASLPSAADKEWLVDDIRSRLRDRDVGEVERILVDLQQQVAEQLSFVDSPRPTFLLCEAKNWPVFAALYPGNLDIEVLDVQGVGSRDVVLAANHAAAGLYRACR